MPQIAQTTEEVYYRDRQVVLYKRERSLRWQARFKLERGGWYRFSTFEKDLKKASAKACDVFDESKYRLKYDKPQVSRRFDSVAKRAIAAMQSELEAEMGKSVYHVYIAVIRQHLIPHFGSKYIDNIEPLEFRRFYEVQEAKQGKPLKRSTINNYNSALNRIFDIAVISGWMGKSQVPVLKNKGTESGRRPDFSIDEYRFMTRRLREWVKKSDGKAITRMIRELLQDYVLVLANTGMRPGKEIDNLKWKHISWYTEKGGEKYVQLDISGKTGKRSIVARHNVQHYLARLQSRFPELANMSLDALIKAKVDDYVFRLSNGKRCTGLAQNFEQFLEENKLLKNSHDETRVLYSLRHTYATFALLRGNSISIHVLAKQMGTSVGMIEKHYSHLTPLLKAKELAGDRYSKHSPTL